ncbi:MAG: DUF1554 domain-containing protein [Bdellovibrionales bacterium]|nr:DUF1554 domain-containing protein [Bdellovibrionales bacterium]
MFIILSDQSGNLKSAGAGSTGPEGADNLCQADTQSTGGTYKALLVDGTNRVACTTANCSGGVSEHTGWVLARNTKYLRADDETIEIGTTNNVGLFEFPLTNSWSALGYDIWTGLNADWTVAADTCSGFTDSNVNGKVGSASQPDSSSISGSIYPCNYYGTTILCVEQ